MNILALIIKGANYSERFEFSPVMDRAVRVTVDSHNLEFPDDPWTIEAETDGATEKEAGAE